MVSASNTAAAAAAAASVPAALATVSIYHNLL